jgi:penicillin-binding protein 2
VRDYAELLDDPTGPLLNRALDPGSSGNLPPPGSTFKPIAALAALSSGLVSPTETFECLRTIHVGPATLGCTGLHNDISMRAALAQSCNIYFYRLADRTGGELLRDAAGRFGFGRPTGLLQGNEVLARYGVPIEEGVHESAVPVREGRFGRVDAMRLAIGQSALDDVTPLQVAVAIGAFGTGELRPPSLLRSIEGYGRLPPRDAVDLATDPASLAVVRDGLERAVDSGTAGHLVLPEALAGLRVAGKTGTPQVENRPDHSWFTGYLPREAPRLAFAILLEHTGEHGGDACVPVFNAFAAQPEVLAYLVREALP